MSFKFRPTTLAIYRIFFVLLIYATGIICSSIWILETYMQVQLLSQLLPSMDNTVYVSLLATSGVTGVAGIVAGSILLSLLADRRIFDGDRRQQDIEIDFPDRRIADRRSAT